MAEQEKENTRELEDKFKPQQGEIKKVAQTEFGIASAVVKNYKPPIQQPVDLIQDQMKKIGKVPGRSEPVFVGEDGRKIFKDPEPDKDNKLKLPPVRDKISTFKIDGFEIPLCGVPQLDALTCFMYIMSRMSQIEASQIPKEIDRVLTAFKFSFPDTTGKFIYPPPTPEPLQTPKRKKRKNQ